MGLIRVTVPELRAKAEELASLNANLKSNVSDLEMGEQNLSTMWEGEAKQAFRQAFNRDKIQMTNFTTLIDKYVMTMQTIAAKYAQAESTNVGIATNRGGSTGGVMPVYPGGLIERVKNDPNIISWDIDTGFIGPGPGGYDIPIVEFTPDDINPIIREPIHGCPGCVIDIPDMEWIPGEWTPIGRDEIIHPIIGEPITPIVWEPIDIRPIIDEPITINPIIREPIIIGPGEGGWIEIPEHEWIPIDHIGPLIDEPITVYPGGLINPDLHIMPVEIDPMPIIRDMEEVHTGGLLRAEWEQIS